MGLAGYIVGVCMVYLVYVYWKQPWKFGWEDVK